MMNQPHTHVRINNGLLADAEKRILVWIARRLPTWVNSDHLTLVALMAMGLAGAAFWAARAVPAAVLLVIPALAVNWFGDSLDGTVARVRRHERPRYGFYVDHVLDMTGLSLLLTGLALSGFMSPVVALALLSAYLLVSSEVFLATAVRGQFRMSFGGFGPTELRIVLAVGALALLWKPVVSPFGLGPFLLFDVGGVVGALGLLVAFVTAAVRNTVALYRAEPLPREETRAARGAIRRALGGIGLAALVGVPPATAAELQPGTITAWEAYVAATEARIDRELGATRGFLVQDFTPSSRTARAQVLSGELIVEEMAAVDTGGTRLSIPDGMIHHWRGSVFLPGVELDGLVRRLQAPSESGPHQQDVLALHVLEQRADGLRLYIKMTRKKLVSVTYNTEHAVTYRRHGPARASSRSVATKIAEVEDADTGGEEREKPPGRDRGFLWRLNSYWRYEQVQGGVIVELESLTLSRDVPLGLRVIVEPLIDRVARESVTRTLQNLRQAHTVGLTRAAR